MLKANPEWNGPHRFPRDLRHGTERGRAEPLGLEAGLIYLAIFLSPFLNLRTDYGFFTLSDALYVVGFVVLLLRRRLNAYPLARLTWLWFITFALVVVGLHASSTLAGDPGRGILLTLQYSFCFVLLPLVLMHDDEDEAYRRILVLVAGTLAVDVHGIIVFHTVGYTPDSRVVTGGLRLATLIGNANLAGCLNAMMIINVLWLRSVGRMSLKTVVVCFAVMVYAIVLSSSNTALIAAVLGTASFVALNFRPRQVFKMLPLLMLPAIILLAGGADYLPAAFQRRVLTALDSGDLSEAGTFVDRTYLMVEAWNIINAREITFLGIGADQFRVLSVQSAPVHNAFLILWVEGGLFSLAGWLVLSGFGAILWALALRMGVARGSREAVFANFVVLAIVSSASPHLYARLWFTAVLLVLQPTLIALSKPGKRRV